MTEEVDRFGEIGLALPIVPNEQVDSLREGNE
jgi:hypothetical protein